MEKDNFEFNFRILFLESFACGLKNTVAVSLIAPCVTISDVLLWDPGNGTAKVGKPVKTYPKLLTEDTGVQITDLPNAMENRELWREIVNSVQATRPI